MAADTATRNAPRPVPGLPAPPWILMYHSVGDPANDPYGITVSRDRLDRQLGWLRRHGLTGVDVGTLLRAHAVGRSGGLVGLTFDDGYADFVHEALPVLRRHDCTATVFVLPGRCGGSNGWDPLGPRKRLLTEEEIAEAARAGMHIGSHGLYHQRLAGVPDDVLRRETSDSRELIRDITGTAPDSFCYPYGTVDARATASVRAAGYTYGFAIAPGPLLGPYALPRTHVSQADRDLRLWAKRTRHRFARHGAAR
ncbi:polysaccharide deacetylase family protein [Streptomyces chryseus]|uniref:Polysaccharide deacetylase n=2 Tax=Streptomyces chryseus TaxID=68186 RepID=A0ABQ3DND5_9ACTN|nr:polysaccharide deacetylase family protein [Streptomyces chryseus]GGX24184.1 polysaccharide deacetylase [Streptomyces chryseus]GHB04005.1 polysaccharide deacetylase [Streptomyces chryseus]